MTADDEDIEREERAIYAIIAMAASPVVIGLMIQGGVIDGGATVSILLVLTALAGLSRLVHRRRLPRARIHTRS